jgi:hypothetical protein
MQKAELLLIFACLSNLAANTLHLLPSSTIYRTITYQRIGYESFSELYANALLLIVPKQFAENSRNKKGVK